MAFKIRQTLIAVFLLLFLFLPPLAGLRAVVDLPVLNEKRLRAPLPAWTWTAEGPATFPKQFEAYYNDHFGFRASLIRGFNYVKVFWLHSSPTDMVLLGKNGWVFYWNGLERDSYRRLKPFSPKADFFWLGYLRLMKDWLGSRNIHWFILIAPNKGTVYPEYMPANIYRGKGPSHLDRLVALAEQEGVPLIDVRQELLEVKKDKKLFFRYDTHWTDAAAYIAYRKLMKSLIPYFPKIKPILEGDLVVNQKSSSPWKDLAGMLGLPEHFAESEQRLDFNIPRKFNSTNFENLHSMTNDIAFETFRKDLPNAVLFRDSFGIALIPFLAQHFNKFIVTEKQGLFPEIVDRERPPIVIIEVLERFLEQEDLFFPLIQWILKKGYGIDWISAADLPTKVGMNRPAAESFWGTVRKASRGKTPAGTLMFGPYTELSPGEYCAVFRLQASRGPRQGPWLKIDVSAEDGNKILTERILTGADFKKAGPWQTFTLSFTVQPHKLERVEYRAEYFGGADVILEDVRVMPREKIALFDRFFPLGKK
ncbi:MAG: hypothetical protein HY892_04050 [Deltaproteobacteria bacterium]|nr:hypothetical protein [Deltaproteobacteria bacterium]